MASDYEQTEYSQSYNRDKGDKDEQAFAEQIKPLRDAYESNVYPGDLLADLQQAEKLSSPENQSAPRLVFNRPNVVFVLPRFVFARPRVYLSAAACITLASGLALHFLTGNITAPSPSVSENATQKQVVADDTGNTSMLANANTANDQTQADTPATTTTSTTTTTTVAAAEPTATAPPRRQSALSLNTTRPRTTPTISLSTRPRLTSTFNTSRNRTISLTRRPTLNPKQIRPTATPRNTPGSTPGNNPGMNTTPATTPTEPDTEPSTQPRTQQLDHDQQLA